jgi:hypothetical protein
MVACLNSCGLRYAIDCTLHLRCAIEKLDTHLMHNTLFFPITESVVEEMLFEHGERFISSELFIDQTGECKWYNQHVTLSSAISLFSLAPITSTYP